LTLSTIRRTPLYIVVPRLGDYKYGVTRLQYNPIHVYPAKLFDITESKVFEVNDEKELKSALKAIFSKPGLRKVISSLLRQAQGH
jgi:hypothetical protein